MDRPEFTVSDLEVPDQVERGEPFDLTASVHNDGAVEATQTVTVLLDESVVETDSLTLDPGETRAVNATLTTDHNGSVDLGVQTTDDERTEQLLVEEPSSVELLGGDATDGLPGFGLGAALVVIAGLLFAASVSGRDT